MALCREAHKRQSEGAHCVWQGSVPPTFQSRSVTSAMDTAGVLMPALQKTTSI